MQMSVAEQRPRRIVALRIGRISVRISPFELGLVRFAGVLGVRRVKCAGGQRRNRDRADYFLRPLDRPISEMSAFGFRDGRLW